MTGNPTIPPPPPTEAPAPIGDQHLATLAEANLRARQVRRAASFAAFNGWGAAVFAILSAPFALFSLTALIMGAGLGYFAWNELGGRKQLLRFEVAAASRLGRNQLLLLALMVVYSVWNIGAAMLGPNPYEEQLAMYPEAANVLQPVADMYIWITVGVYGTIIVLTAIFQGLGAWYYFSRRRIIEAFLADTPDWVVDVQRTNAA